jgi:hypothetical protein
LIKWFAEKTNKYSQSINTIMANSIVYS